jgi:hypothetical protein
VHLFVNRLPLPGNASRSCPASALLSTDRLPSNQGQSLDSGECLLRPRTMPLHPPGGSSSDSQGPSIVVFLHGGTTDSQQLAAGVPVSRKSFARLYSLSTHVLSHPFPTSLSLRAFRASRWDVASQNRVQMRQPLHVALPDMLRRVSVYRSLHADR